MRLRLVSLLLLLIGLLAAQPATAPAAVTIGSSLTSDATENLGASCSATAGSPCTATNVTLPAGRTAPGGLMSPITGVVVRWSVKSGSQNNAVRLRILRPNGMFAGFRGVGTSDPATTAATTSSFPTRLPIRAGDAIGLNVEGGALVFGASDPTTTSLLWSSPTGLAEGGTGSAGTAQNDETLVQATIEPDADRDGFGDETQDACPADATRHTAPCTTTGTGTPPGTSAPVDTTAPTLSRLALSPTTLRLGHTAHVRFAVTERARVTLTYARLTSGRRVGTRCLAPGHGRTGRRCTRSTHVGSTTTQATGVASVAFTGRVAGHTLRVGRYRVTATAIDAAGNVSTPRSATFRVSRRAVPARR